MQEHKKKHRINNIDGNKCKKSARLLFLSLIMVNFVKESAEMARFLGTDAHVQNIFSSREKGVLLMLLSLRKRLQNQKGFSFIELLVAVVIIGILASMMVPRVVGVMSDAKKKACQANIKSLESAFERYYAKEDIYPDDLASLIPDYINEIPRCPVDQNLAYENDYTVDLPNKQSYVFNHSVH